MFAKYDIVVMSCAVNALIRDDRSASSLFGEVGPKLEKYCRACPNTWFVYNSVILTSDRILNEEIGNFNTLMFELSLKIDRNMWFLDTHQVMLVAVSEGRVNARRVTRDGIHLSRDSKNFLHGALIHYLTGMILHSGGSYPWILRPRFVFLAKKHRELHGY